MRRSGGVWGGISLNGTDLYSDIKRQVFSSVCERLVRNPGADDAEAAEVIKACIIADPRADMITARQRGAMLHELFNRIRRLDVLQDLLDDDTVTEIMVNGTDEIFVEREGRLTGTGIRFESKERLVDIIGKIASGVNRTINLSSPILDARLPADGSRINAVLDPVAINGPSLTIRRFPRNPIDARMLVASGSITEPVLEFLKMLVMSGYNILISGSTGCGKTTFLNIMSSFIPKDERVVTIEDSAELRIMGIRNLVRLETRSATSGGREITIRDLIKTALRMRPDRIVVGEVRGEEAIDMLQAFNVGQDGSLSTIHANSAGDAISRLETMVMLSTDIPIEALRRQIASGVDIIVHLGRLRDKSRHVLEIMEVTGMSGSEVKLNTLYRFAEAGTVKGKIEGMLIKEHELVSTGKLLRAGYDVLPEQGGDDEGKG